MSGLQEFVARNGHVLVRAEMMRGLLERHGVLSDWPAFSASWNDLHLDNHMADSGRYRRRRYAVYEAAASGVMTRQPHQAHYQSRDYNHLNGGVERWFEPINTFAGSGPSMQTILRFCHSMFGQLAGAVRTWRIEAHQFRIEASLDMQGQPTPEGVHRDGVDYVLVLMIRRHNIVSGTTTIHAPDGRSLGSFTLTDPFDATLIDDVRVYHGVTAVTPLDPSLPAYRDVLVVSFRRA